MSEFMATDLQLLRLFVKVAEHGNISHAANACGMSQPSVSRALNALERELQAKLFHRTGRGVRLTSMGEHALMRAQAIVSQSDSLVREIRDLASAPHGKVTLALLTAHMRGLCVVAVYTRDIAETKATQATDMAQREGFPLLFTTEPED